jgi:large subunit ribosomal protein L26e
LNFFSF